MGITVKAGSALARLLDGRRQVETQGATLGEVLDNLGVRDRLCDTDGRIRRHFNLHINGGEDVRLLQGLDTPVKDGDEVALLSAIAGGAGVARKVWLTFPRDLVERPLIWEVGRKFEVVTNIRQASVSKEVGIVGLELSGEAEAVQEAVDFLTGAGVSVEPVELGVVE
jgi:molybdopterin converting factor small subunit